MSSNQSIQELNNRFKEFFLLEGFDYIEPPLVVNSDIILKLQESKLEKICFQSQVRREQKCA